MLKEDVIILYNWLNVLLSIKVVGLLTICGHPVDSNKMCYK